MNNTDNTIENIGHKIKYFRNLHKVSLSKLAKEANISKSTLFGLEEGKSNPTISTLINISKTLNIKLTELIGQNSEDSSKSTLEKVSNINNRYVYKLSMVENQIFIFNENIYSKIELISIDGQLLDLSNSTFIEQNKTITLKHNNKLKASKGGATAIVTITRNTLPNYIKDDIFLDKMTTKKLEHLSKIAQATKALRAISSSLYPVEHPQKARNVQLIEIVEDKELHYYFVATFIGIIGGVSYIINKLDLKPTSQMEIILNFINKANTQDMLSSSDLQNIPSNPADSLISELSSLIIKKYGNCKLLSQASKLSSLECKSGTYILIIDELIKEAESRKNLIDSTTIIDIYRAAELTIPIKENELNNEELEFYLKARATLAKALYFAKYGYTDLAILHLEKLTKSKKTIISHNAMTLYLEAINIINKTLNKREELEAYTSLETLEKQISDLNLDIIVKKDIHESANRSSKYLYLLKA